jgi:thiol-disulfide isomerase/thioredoxin
MTRTRALLLGLLASLSAAPLALAGEAKESIRVSTEAVPPPKPGANDGAMRAQPHGTPLDLDAAAPAGVAAPPAGAKPATWAEWKAGGRTVTVAFVRGAGDALTVYADANGDRKFDAAEAATAAVVPQDDRPGRPTNQVSWKLDPWPVAGTQATLAVTEVLPALTGRMTLQGAGRGGPAKTLTFGAEKPATVVKAPAFSGSIQWATTKVGEKEIAVAAARGDGVTMRVAVDRDADGDLSEEAEAQTIEGKRMRRGSRSGVVETGARWDGKPVEVEGVSVRLSVTEFRGDMNATVQATVVRKGTADVAGVRHALFLVDGDFDGKIGGADDFWWFGKARDADPKDRKNHLTYANMFEATEAAFGGGKTWRLASVGADGAAVVEPAPAVDVEAYFHRRGDRVNAKRWFPRFDLEAPVFAEDQKLGAPRPKAPKAAAWHHAIDFEEARAFAKKENKPLLVDFEADWCVWCKRVDYYTYPDAEVASWLSKFALVKLNVDFDEKRSFDAFGFGGLPAIAAFDRDGKPVRFTSTFPNEKGEDAQKEDDKIPGWSKPERFVLHLKNLYEAWQKKNPTTGGN